MCWSANIGEIATALAQHKAGQRFTNDVFDLAQ